MIARQVEADGGEDVADACGIDRAAGDEECAVGAQPRGESLQPAVVQPQTAQVIDRLEHRRGVRRASAEAGTRGDELHQLDAQRWQVKLLLQEAVGAHGEVLFVRAAVGRGVALEAETRRRGGYLDYVADVDGIEDGLDVVVSVLAPGHYVEPDVNLGIGEYYHSLTFDALWRKGSDKICHHGVAAMFLHRAAAVAPPPA